MSAPSFSSFPPMFSSFPDLEPGPSTSKEDKVKGSSGRGQDNIKGKKKGNRKHKRGDVSKLDRESGRKHGRSKAYELYEDKQQKDDEDTTFRDARESILDGKPTYYSDRKGDQLNVTYGGLHVHDIPKYYPVDRRKILGLPAWTVVHRGRHEIAIAVGSKRKMPGLTDSSSRHLLTAPPKRRLLASSKDKYKYNEVEGFLRISTHRRTGDPSYRSITAQASNTDSDVSGSSSEDDGDGSTDSDSEIIAVTSLQATIRSLEERLSADPRSISTWFSLLSHTLSTIPMSSKNSIRTRSDIALSILSRALAAHPENRKSKRLRLRYIKAGEGIWSADQLRAEWEKALEVGGGDMWLDWLDWRVRVADNGLESVIESALRTLAVFKAEDAELGQLRVFWRVAVAFRDAGFVERAMALFQAQAEMMFNAPTNLAGIDFDETLEALEVFWESEVPRVGEPAATGWASWENAGRPEVQTTRSRSTIGETSSLPDPFSRWASDEMCMERLHTLPSRSFDSEDDGDPYATILFSDIQPLLLELRSSSARNAFRHVWLLFLGLQIPGFSASLSPVPAECSDDRWVCHHLASPAYLASIFPSSDAAGNRVTADSSAGTLIGREKEYASPFGPVKNWGYGVLGPLDRIGDTQWGMWTEEDVRRIDVSVVREVFRQCRLSNGDEEWDVLNVAFEATLDAKNALKISKSILASADDSLPRWATHARIERTRGRTDAARKIYQAVLSAPSETAGQSILWWDWAEMEWLSGNSDASHHVIHRCAGAEGSGGIAILRAKRSLEETAGRIPSTRWREREALMKLRALLELIISTPVAAAAYLDTQLAVLQTGSNSHESLTLASLVLLYTYGYVLKNPTPPALLRDRAQKAIEAYPNNTAILGLFLESERGQGVWGRVRAMLGEGTTGDGDMGKEKAVARKVAEVWVARWERSRWEAEEERTRGGLSAAVEDERTRGSAVLWRIYLEFEIRFGQLQRAKKLLYRAVGECPLVKELYLLAFGPLRSVFTGRELHDWAETMVERGIRLRRGLDEALEGWTERGGEVDEGMGGEDEIEYNARELRRLRPY